MHKGLDEDTLAAVLEAATFENQSKSGKMIQEFVAKVIEGRTVYGSAILMKDRAYEMSASNDIRDKEQAIEAMNFLLGFTLAWIISSGAHIGSKDESSRGENRRRLTASRRNKTVSQR